MNALSLKQSNELIRIAMEKAIANYKRPICVAVCDAAGLLISLQRMEGAPLRSIAISQGKAYSAARMQTNTDAFFERVQKANLHTSWFCDEKITALPGGAIFKDSSGAIIGAVGISGLASEEDQAIANHLAERLASGAV